MTHKEIALGIFERKYHCSQAVLAAFAEECGLTEVQALKLGGSLQVSWYIQQIIGCSRVFREGK